MRMRTMFDFMCECTTYIDVEIAFVTIVKKSVAYNETDRGHFSCIMALIREEGVQSIYACLKFSASPIPLNITLWFSLSQSPISPCIPTTAAICKGFAYSKKQNIMIQVRGTKREQLSQLLASQKKPSNTNDEDDSV
ncbi:hypothetical protein R6Q59_013171 [Mikania micrantha]